jgi:hypothetical protein
MREANHTPTHGTTVFFIAVAIITIAAMQQFTIDSYVVDTLMPDLVLHDRRPSTFLVYLHLWYRTAGSRQPLRTSHQEMADRTGLSKSAVQSAIRILVRRRLVRAVREGATAVPAYTVLRPWRK